VYSRKSIIKAAKLYAKSDVSNRDLIAPQLIYLRDIKSKIFGQHFKKVNDCLKKITTNQPYITGRIKREEAIINKIRRGSLDVTTMIDIVGFRILTSSLAEQDKIVRGLQSYFKTEPNNFTNNDKDYRAIHFRIEEEKFEGLPNIFEIQIRTYFQHIWATWSESFGQRIKETFSHQTNNLPLNLKKIKNWLNIFTKTIKDFEIKNHNYNQIGKKKSVGELKYYLIHYLYKEKELASSPSIYYNIEDAKRFFYLFERLNRKENKIEIVLALSDNEDNLKMTHSRYFSVQGAPKIPNEISPNEISPSHIF
jgi:ppGpp synthetase/RelA/SpoT-type nucleotidyltranferase|tara:strand:- start:379 stop:1302 length:924 start_codon:yes stop_codon:yes gene_type:complete